MTQTSLIAIGANILGNFEALQDALRHGAGAALACGRLKLKRVSGLYDTAPHGARGRQPRYLNAVLLVETRMAPAELLRHLKRIERQAGRRQRGRNCPRPLDLDIIDVGGRSIGWRARLQRCGSSNALRSYQTSRRGRAWLTLPHPEMHRRRFVLEPLIEVAPHWHHPVLGVAARRLLARLPRPPAQITRVLDSRWLLCEKGLAGDLEPST